VTPEKSALDAANSNQPASTGVTTPAGPVGSTEGTYVAMHNGGWYSVQFPVKYVQCLLGIIDKETRLRGILWDFDLLPEQLENGSDDWKKMLLLAHVFRSGMTP
jgi:hypothetical protein